MTPSRQRGCPLNDDILFAAIVFMFALIGAYAIRPYDFLNGAETNGFLHLDLRDCFTIKDELANGEHSSAGCQ